MCDMHWDIATCFFLCILEFVACTQESLVLVC